MRLRKSLMSMEDIGATSSLFTPDNPTVPALAPPAAAGSTVPAPTDTPPVVDEISDVDLCLAEADSAMRHEQNHVDSLGRVMETNSTLGGIAEQLECSVRDGDGVNQANLAALSIAVEHFCAKLSLGKAHVKKQYSPESFKDKESRVRATLEEANDIREKMKHVGQKIVETLKKILLLAAKFFDQILDAAGSLRNKAMKIIDRAEESKGLSISGNTKIPAGRFGQALLVGGRYQVGAAVLSTFGTYAKNKALNTDWFTVWDSAKIETFIEDKEKALEIVLSVKDRQMSEKDGVHYSTDLLFADSYFMQYVGKDGSYKSAIDNAGNERDPLTECVPLNPEQVAKLCRMIDIHLKRYENLKGGITRFFENAMKSFTRAADAEGDDQKSPAELKEDLDILRQMTYANGAMLNRFDLKVCKCLLDYSTASLDALHREEKPEPNNNKA